jgi:predicted RNase H-like nuclease (RuvC/YqgF family)
MDDDTTKSAEKALADCEEKVDHLREENAMLRRSAKDFGDLAERLNAKRRVAKVTKSERTKRPSSS